MIFFDRLRKQIEESAQNAKKSISNTTQSHKFRLNETYSNIPTIKNTVDNTYTHIQKFTSSVNRFSRYTRYSMILTGTGILLFGIGYAMRPIADIYRTHRRTKYEK